MTRETKGLWLGALGVLIFSATMPMTKIAVGTEAQPQLAPVFITFARLAIAGLLSACYLLLGKKPWPDFGDLLRLQLTGLFVGVGFPMGIGLALRTVPSGHGAVVTGLLPLMTAVVAAIWFRHRPPLSFWGCALIGCSIVVTYLVIRAGGFKFEPADGYLFLAVLSAAVGYVSGARLTARYGAEATICWALLGLLPLSMPLAWYYWPKHPEVITGRTWAALGYLSVFSMWLGFFAWYRGLALGGAVRVSQVQLVMPFLSLLLAVPLLGEKLDPLGKTCALSVCCVIALSQRLATRKA